VFHGSEQSTLFANLFFHFEIELTADGSPTARLKKQGYEKNSEPKLIDHETRLESMHNSQGAASETAYIYTLPFKLMQKFYENKNSQSSLSSMNILVVGLGLGYIELSLLLQIYKFHLKPNRFKLASFEKVDELKNNFQKSILGLSQNYNQQNQQSSLEKLYDLIIEKIFEQQVEKIEFTKKQYIEFIKNTLSDSSDQWSFYKELALTTQLNEKYQFVAFDAFSQKTDEPLWSEEFLNYFLTTICDQNCIFTTYACTGVLKKTLIKNGFIFIKRTGFKGKRDATLAIRGDFSTDLELFQNV